MRKILNLIIVAGACWLTVAASAQAATERAHRGDVTAILTFKGRAEQATHVRLTITKAGRTLYSRAVHSPFCGSSCIPPAPSVYGQGLQVLDIEANGRPDVILPLFSGGAHCCEIVQIFRLRPSGRSYEKVERNFGNGGTRIERLGRPRRYVFVADDESFFYEFASYAESGVPIQILRFRDGRFANVTRRYPRQIAADAAIYWKLFTHHLRSGEGVFAAWAADEAMLGHAKLVRTTLTRELRHHHLNGDLPGKQYVKALLRFLRQHGYMR